MQIYEYVQCWEPIARNAIPQIFLSFIRKGNAPNAIPQKKLVLVIKFIVLWPRLFYSHVKTTNKLKPYPFQWKDDNFSIPTQTYEKKYKICHILDGQFFSNFFESAELIWNFLRWYLRWVFVLDVTRGLKRRKCLTWRGEGVFHWDPKYLVGCAQARTEYPPSPLPCALNQNCVL